MEVYIYRNAFSVQGGTPRLGYASAAGVLFGLTVMLVALTQAWALRWARRARADADEGR
jgi:ABC-type sugar transport system permease subunit